LPKSTPGGRLKDFFVSYSAPDRQWAEWIAWQLEENGHTVILQAWDFRPGGNCITDIASSAQDRVSVPHRLVLGPSLGE
jgi:TIR domain